MSVTVNPDRLAELEDERRFLLRSLRDLDAELAAGDVDDADYETLRDGYTKRAADVLREHRGRTRRAARRARPPSWGRRLAIVAVVLAVAAVGGWLVAAVVRPAPARAGDHRRARADDVAVLLAEARALLGTDIGAAQERYQQVLDERPDHPEALTYSAWLLFIGSSGANEELRARRRRDVA